MPKRFFLVWKSTYLHLQTYVIPADIQSPRVSIIGHVKRTKNRHFFSLIFNDYDDGVQVKHIYFLYVF